jgi:uncharacterized peroxidase-related enzyme
MSNLKKIDPTEATGKSKQLLDAVQQKLGGVPNMFRIMANSPATLEAYLNFNASLATGSLGAKLREQIAVAVAEANTCNYCLSAHTALGKLAGLTAEQLEAARNGNAESKPAAALHFAQAIVRNRGSVESKDLTALRTAGFGDGEIAEIIATVAVNIFTNYFNHITNPEIDFPVVKAASASAR